MVRRIISRWDDGKTWWLEIDDSNTALITAYEVGQVNTASQVPVPSLRDALGQHITARVLRRAGYESLPPYHPERHKEVTP